MYITDMNGIYGLATETTSVEPIYKNYSAYFLSKKIVTKLSNIWVWDLESEIRNPGSEIRDPRSGIQDWRSKRHLQYGMKVINKKNSY
jgi:hypothetical protein